MASFHIMTFGCKVNQCDSQIVRETLASWGLTETGKSEADVVVINTCTVTGTADGKFRKALKRARRENPRSLIAVTGCFATAAMRGDRNPPEADSVFSTGDMGVLADVLRHYGLIDIEPEAGPCRQTYFAEHTRAFLKIQDGCDCFCTYCVVPLVRTEFWNEHPDKVVAAVNDLSAEGYREVVLSGIHLGFYGRGTSHGTLLDLLRRLEANCEIDRIRLSSIEIHEVSDAVLDLVATSDKFCHHFHVPLQSGDAEILRKMDRRYSPDFYMRRIEDIRRKIPDAGITTDVMVGFPGETEEHFERTMDIVRDVGFMKIHAFRFSARPGTVAAGMDSPVPAREVSSRARRLIALGDEISRRVKEQFIGHTMPVLVESGNGRTCAGLTSNYMRVNVLNPPPDSLNHILTVQLSGSDPATGSAVGSVA